VWELSGGGPPKKGANLWLTGWEVHRPGAFPVLGLKKRRPGGRFQATTEGLFLPDSQNRRIRKRRETVLLGKRRDRRQKLAGIGPMKGARFWRVGAREPAGGLSGKIKHGRPAG